jgi:hypothetical protein
MHSSSLTHTRGYSFRHTPSLSRSTTLSLPPTHTDGVRARREDVHACTHSLAHTRGYTVERIFVRRATSRDNLMRVESFT